MTPATNPATNNATPIVVTYLRHGEPSGPPNIFRGRVDVPLTETGWQQMWRATEQVPPATTLLSSPRSRCVAFADAWGERHGIRAHALDDLAEMDFGDWDGLTHADIRARFGPDVDAFRADPFAVAPPNGESLHTFIARVARTVDTVRQQAGPILVVTHAGVMRAAIGQCLGINPGQWNRIAIGYAATARISYLAGTDPILLDLASNV